MAHNEEALTLDTYINSWKQTEQPALFLGSYKPYSSHIVPSPILHIRRSFAVSSDDSFSLFRPRPPGFSRVSIITRYPFWQSPIVHPNECPPLTTPSCIHRFSMPPLSQPVRWRARSYEKWSRDLHQTPKDPKQLHVGVARRFF